MRMKVLTGDILDFKIMTAEGFNVCVISEVYTDHVESDRIFIMTGLYPNNEIIENYIAHQDRDEFEKSYFEYLDNSNDAQMCIAALMYGLAKKKKMGIVNFIKSIADRQIFKEEMDINSFAFIPITECLSLYLAKNYGIEPVHISQYIEKYVKRINPHPFEDGEIPNKEAYIALMDRFKDFFDISEEDYFKSDNDETEEKEKETTISKYISAKLSENRKVINN